jgi:hypothetical protein
MAIASGAQHGRAAARRRSTAIVESDGGNVDASGNASASCIDARDERGHDRREIDSI